MIFPITVTFNKRLKAIITPDDQQQVLQYIAKSILDDKADKVNIKDLQVTYKGSTSNRKGSLFGSVDDGAFIFIYKNNSWWLNYQINMRELFIYTAIIAGIMEVVVLLSGSPWWVGLFMFSWLCGGNWIINVARHENEAATIAAEIDELICGKIEIPEQDKMTGELKSWF